MTEVGEAGPASLRVLSIDKTVAVPSRNRIAHLNNPDFESVLTTTPLRLQPLVNWKTKC